MSGVRRLLDQPGHESEDRADTPGQDEGLVGGTGGVEPDVVQDTLVADALVVGQVPGGGLLVETEHLGSDHCVQVVRVGTDLDGVLVGVHVFSFDCVLLNQDTCIL